MGSQAANDNIHDVSNILYVVLHGLVSLVELPSKGFRAYLFDMGDEHRCLCGDFFAEQEMDYDSAPYLELKGNFVPGNATLDADTNAVLKLSKAPNFTDGEVVSTIDFPTPTKIIQFIRGNLSKGALADPQSELKSMPTQLSGIRILQYSLQNVSDFDGVRLALDPRDNMWVCPPPNNVGGVGNVAVLHIYNEPPDTLSPAQAAAHNLDEFNRSAALFGSKVTLTNAAVVPVTPRCTSPAPGGLTGLDITPLDLRDLSAVGLMDWLRKIWAIQIQVTGEKGSSQSKEATAQRIKEVAAAVPKTLIEELICILGGGGGTQVCGGINGTVTG